MSCKKSTDAECPFEMSQNALQTEQMTDASTTVPVTTVNVTRSTQNANHNVKGLSQIS